MVADVHPIWLAQSKLRRRRYDECIQLCTDALQRNPVDQVAWYLKCRAITLKSWIDDTEIEEEGVADLLMDEHNVAQVARPGTSLARPMTGAAASGQSPVVRPMTGSGRPLTGFVRPGTSAARPGTGSTKPGTALAAALKAARPGTGSSSSSRPLTTSGRFVRLGTASLAAAGHGGPFIAAERLDLRKYAARPHLARVLCDYILYVDHNMQKVLELAGHATAEAGFADWWWKERLGKAYYQLGLLRDAEKQLASAAKNQDMLVLTHQLAKISTRLDQPLAALSLFSEAAGRHPGDIGLLLGQARLQEGLGNRQAALALYHQVLALDASNVEAIACLAADHFYSDQPELALRYYRRLLQMGVVSAETWANLGLCCFYAGQYDFTFSCFERALALAGDAALPDIWYNIGQVAIGIGDLSWAQQCFRLAAALDPGHAEALNNLGVLQLKRRQPQQAASCFRAGMKAADHVFELHYNAALLAHRQGDLQEAVSQVKEALALYPEHTDSLELKKLLKAQLNAL
ncbi:hypothetical protein OEZ85_006009 [Tetradesmus obliquus]|uniref:Bardet-Biedl syndrome 8 n=1 Tax=Tetradesmus obliquus TaxID=3088 RepID=A0ABY8UFK4_TETOB|nr:hypothetical protein OEZ85_006009 [Tetradesmus obliquus]